MNFHCKAIIRAKEDLGDHAADEDGFVKCVLVLQTSSGRSCSAFVNVIAENCADFTAPAWDDVNSATSIDQSQSVSVFITGGRGPYTWSVSGTGFSMASAQTTGLSNTLVANASACGNAVITVTDACDLTCSGIVQCTEGRWRTITEPFGTGGTCKCTGPPDEGTSLNGTVYCPGWKTYEWKYWGYGCSGYTSICNWCPTWTPCITGYSYPTTSSPCSVQPFNDTCAKCYYYCQYSPTGCQMIYRLSLEYRENTQWICDA
jgi:hypothetical protein